MNNNPNSITDKVIFVTGALGQIGKEVSFSFLKQNAKVVFTDIVLNAQSDFANELNELGIDPANYLFCKLDITSEENCTEAVEAAVANGDVRLANTILAARHQRRLRLAGKIENNIKTAQAHDLKLAQRRAYRENLVKTASNNAKKANTRTAKNTSEFVKAQDLNNSAKNAFAAKAIASGFPAEYVEAMLNTTVAEKPAVVEIKQVMASNLTANVKKTVVANMIKESELDSANINRCKDYWKNELGYGDPELVDELFKNS